MGTVRTYEGHRYQAVFDGYGGVDIQRVPKMWQEPISIAYRQGDDAATLERELNQPLPSGSVYRSEEERNDTLLDQYEPDYPDIDLLSATMEAEGVEVFEVRHADDGRDREGLPVDWYWWYCMPGYLPSSDPSGPFASEEAAMRDAYDTPGMPGY